MMTTLTLVPQRVLPGASALRRCLAVAEHAAAFGRRGIISAVLIGVIAASAAAYAAMTVMMFSTGVQLRTASSVRAAEERAVGDLEVRVRQRETEIATHATEILPGMEKVSAVMYLGADSVAMNRTR